MRFHPLLLALTLAACGSGDGGNNASDAAPSGGNAAMAPAAAPTGPPPKTPVLSNVPVAPGNEAEWMEPQPSDGAPVEAPYGNVLSEPVVQGRPAR